MGELSGKTNKTVKQLFQVKLTFFATLPHARIPQAKKNRLKGGWDEGVKPKFLGPLVAETACLAAGRGVLELRRRCTQF